MAVEHPKAPCLDRVWNVSGNGAAGSLDTSILKTLRRMHDARSTRLALGLTLAEMGARIGQLRNHGHAGAPYGRGTVSQWELRSERRYRMTADTRGCYARIVEDVIRGATAGRVAIRARMGPRVWRFKPVGHCATCGREFVLEHSRQKKCRRCRARCKRST